MSKIFGCMRSSSEDDVRLSKMSKLVSDPDLLDIRKKEVFLMPISL